jgi:hypothetical protein
MSIHENSLGTLLYASLYASTRAEMNALLSADVIF